MKYVNNETGLEIDLGDLLGTRKKFYETVLEKFQANTSWLEFDRFVFNMRSLIFLTDNGKARSSKEIFSDPLYGALKDMSLQLGVQQGKIKRKNKEER